MGVMGVWDGIAMIDSRNPEGYDKDSGFCGSGFCGSGFCGSGFYDLGFCGSGFYDLGFCGPGFCDLGFYASGFYGMVAGKKRQKS